MPWTAQSVWHNSICVSVVDDIAGDDATAGACDEATAASVLYDLHSVHLKTVCPVGAGRTGLMTQC